MKTLAEIYSRYAGVDYGDKGTVHDYIRLYEKLLAPYRHTAKRILEIGILAGHSIRMFEEYFDGAVYGVDLNLKPLDKFDLTPMVLEGTHHLLFLDATNPEQVEQHFKGMTFDVIIEDASHAFEHQMSIYANLKSHLSEGGIYVIEDVADLDAHRREFQQMAEQVRIYDRRLVKGRFDDVLVVIGGKYWDGCDQVQDCH